MSYKIETGVPIPPRYAQKGTMVALRALRVGDSFLLESNRKSSIYQYAKRIGIRVRTGLIDDPAFVRVWRIEDKK